MDYNIFDRIKSKSSVFTKSEKIVAEFIMSNANDLLYTSISELANMCGVGDATVFRFCKTLQLKGYQEFRTLLAMSVPIGDEKAREENLNQIIDENFEPKEVVEKVYNNNLRSLDETLQAVDYENYNKAVNALAKANRISFFGAGASGIVAYAAYNIFLRVKGNVSFVNDTHLQSMEASLMQPGDVAIVFSYSGSTKDTLEIAKQAKRAGAIVISVTRHIPSPIAQQSDVSLKCGFREGPYEGGSAAAMLSQLCIIDFLYYGYFLLSSHEARENRRKTTDSITEKLL